MDVTKLIKELRNVYGEPMTALTYKTPLQLLVSTILSAQCTDVRVNEVCKTLYKKYKKAENFASARIEDLEQDIKPTGFYRQKAKFIQNTCKALIEKHNGQVPDTMEELLELPGVARKTANVVLQNAFNKTEGIVVDTHVGRVSKRLGLHNQKDPVKIEQELMKIIPKNEWIFIDHALIEHGRALCQSRKPKCPECFLKNICPSSKELIEEHYG